MSVRKPALPTAAVPLTEVLHATLRRWPWIVLSVAVCVGAMYYKLLCTPTTFTRSAELLLKEENQTAPAGLDMLPGYNLQNLSYFTNEMVKLQSKDMMEEVVKRLELDMNYRRKATFYNPVVYGDALPVRVKIIDMPAENLVSFDVNVAPNGIVKISKLLADNVEKSDYVYSGKLGDTIKTPVGQMVVSPATAYVKGEEVELMVEKAPLDAVRSSFSGRLAIDMSNDDSAVMRLSMSDESTQRADDVLNGLIAVYNEHWIKDKNQIAASTSNFINDRLAVIESELGNVDSDISSYKSANMIPDVEAASSMYMNQSQANATQILELNNQLQMARFVRQYLSSDANRNQLLPTNTGLQGAQIQTQVAEYNTKMLERNDLLSKSSDKNPVVIQLDRQLEQQRQAMVRSIDNEIVSLNNQIKTLRSAEAHANSRIASNPNQAKYLLSVERQQKVKESLYLYLLQKREENELTQAFTAYNTQIVTRPSAGPGAPMPNRRNMLAMALLVGLALPFAFTYGQMTLNTKVRGRTDLEGLGAPFLGEIPMYKPEGKAMKHAVNVGNRILVENGGRDAVNEAFRVLRTNFEFLKNKRDRAEVVAVTSFNPGSGKSLLTMNLAVALALKGKRVLVVDGDLRHCSASAYVGSPKLGLSNYLIGNPDDVRGLLVHDTLVEGLDVLPVGTIPPNPTELLESSRLGDMLELLRDQYDYILMDCPPIEMVADTQIIAQLADRTVFVVRAGLFERSMLPQIERLYSEKRFNNMSLVLNGTMSFGRHGYGYGYGYRYGSYGKE